jgi:hypothetical protein
VSIDVWYLIRFAGCYKPHPTLYDNEDAARDAAESAATENPHTSVHVLRTEVVDTVIVGDRPVKWRSEQ